MRVYSVRDRAFYTTIKTRQPIHQDRPSTDRKREEHMKNITKNEARKIIGGSAYCLVCGYGYYNNYSDWKVMAHIASRHPGRVARGMAVLIGKVFL